MDFSSDFVRREARESQSDHVSAMRSMKDLVGRLFNGESTESPFAKADFATGGLNRRRFIQFGGLTVATAAVFAACGTDDSDTAKKPAGEKGEAPKTSPAEAQGDIQILRTASSLEVLAVDVYEKAIQSGLVLTPAVGDAAMLFQSQHREHAELFQGATKKLGGKPMTDPNPVVAQSLEGPIAALKDETSVIQLALMLEQAAAATYQSSVGQFKDVKLNQAVMSVGGVEARHAAILAGVLKQPQVPKAFQTKDGAVAAGTGV
ncbi:MAG: ferritin-like domain-containing protein [Actinobacteria bacterium]|nr:ferritin-like domain-containing protein [Actinomycetota bacterium]MBW3650898.1 ferritin-like domain-containing protein [Actinomycetota bacterium]